MAFFGNGLVIRHSRVAEFQQAGDGTPPSKPTGDINLSNILKLVPGDVVAIYLAGKGITADKVMNFDWPTVLFWLCLLVCILLRVLATLKAPGGINWLLIVVTAVAFFIWAHAVNTSGPVIQSFNGSVAGFVAMLFGLIAPLAVPAQSE